jgi:tRNA threonylcarbamoyladenosine biosynthesis protein TsaB
MMVEANHKQSSSESLPVILGLDTSSKLTSIAIARGSQIIANFEVELDDNRSARLWELMDFLLKAVGLKVEDVNLFAACTGPGGFTGLRVGIAAIKGLAAATQKPTVGVTSLEALAAMAFPAVNVCILSNAYKGEVYTQRFSYDGQGLPVAESAPAVCLLAEALERVGEINQLNFAGDGADLNGEAILRFKESLLNTSTAGKSAAGSWGVKSVSRFLAGAVARLAYYKFLSGQALEPEKLKACYVRSADVKIKQV